MIDIDVLCEKIRFEVAARGFKLNGMFLVTAADHGKATCDEEPCGRAINQRELTDLLAFKGSESDLARGIVDEIANVFKAHEPANLAAENESLRKQLAELQARVSR